MLPSEYRAVWPLQGALLHTPNWMPPLMTSPNDGAAITLSKPLDTASTLLRL